MIHWELCKELKFDHTSKWYIYNQESVLEKATQKLLRDFEIQTDHLILARQPDHIIININNNNNNNNNNKKRPYKNVDFAVPADHRVKLKESKKKDNYQDLAWEWRKTVEHESDSDPNCNWCCWYRHQRIGKRTGGLENNGTSGDHLNYRIIKIGPGY